jgi:hypothetical protein
MTKKIQRQLEVVQQIEELPQAQLGNIAEKFEALVSGIASDLGGMDYLTTVQRQLVDAFAGAAINIQDLNARLLLGEEVDLTKHATAVSTLVRLAARIGTARVSRNVGESVLTKYLVDTAELVDD